MDNPKPGFRGLGFRVLGCGFGLGKITWPDLLGFRLEGMLLFVRTVPLRRHQCEEKCIRLLGVQGLWVRFRIWG